MIIHAVFIQIMRESLTDSGKIASMQIVTFSNLKPSKKTNGAISKELVITIVDLMR